MESDDIDYCANCGAEHGYMCGPCEKCGSTIFTREKPETDEPEWDYQELIGNNP